MTVYLAGPIEGIPDEQINTWRNLSKIFLDKYGITTLDPCRRKKFHDQEYSMNLANRIVRMDLRDIDESDVVLANLSELGAAKAWGTVSEVTYSSLKGKTIIVVLDKGYHHPFIESFATEVHNSLKNALESIVEYYV